MATYIKAYLGEEPLYQADASAWVRPSDWLTLPAAPSDGIKALHAIFNNSTNFVAVRFTTSNGAAYTIDWGDGNVESASSSSVINHNYDWNNVSSSTITSGGYRQAIVTITPPSGATFSLANISEKYTGVSGLQAYSTGWLDMNINLPNLITGQRLIIGQAATRNALLERVNIQSWGNITSLDSLFLNCSALQEINSSEWNLSNITTLAAMFFGCNSIKVIDASTWDTSLVTSLTNTLRSCNSLIGIKCSGWDTGAVTTMANFALTCYSLQKIDVSNWDVSNLSSFQNAFNSCSSLQELAIGNWQLTNLTNAQAAFGSCFNLKDLKITSLSLPICTNISTLFENCYALQEIGSIDVSAATNATNLCNNCNSLKSADFIGINATTTFANCMLSGSELNSIYTALSANGAGKTITVTGNYGTSTDDPTIATAKGWTVIPA
jgi:surface protein